MRQPQPALSRRSFVLFALLAPAGLLVIAGIIALLQYRQFRSMVSPQAAVMAPAWTAADSARHESLLAVLKAFSGDAGPDTLSLSPEDLTLLAASSPAANSKGFRIRILAKDSLLASESSRPVDSLEGGAAAVFKRLSPVENGWLNARVEGLPQWKDGALALDPARGYLNGVKVPRTALAKRGGLSPRDFLAPEQLPAYQAFLEVLDTVVYVDGRVVLIRKNDE
jgi:hypothetical protein